MNGGDFGAMLRRLQDTFTESEPWEEQRPGYWSTFIGIADDRFSLWLMLPFANANRYARAEALLVTRDIPPGVRTEMAVFSLFANRFFSGWDLFVKDFDEDGLRVNSVGTFVAIESIDALPPQLVETLVARTVRTAVVAVPAVQAIIEGASAAEALKIADRHDDEVGSFDPAHDVSVGDEALIDDAEGAVAAVEGTVIWGFRSDATQLQIHSYAVGGAIEPGRFFVDARDHTVFATAYAPVIVPEARLPAVAELLTGLANKGVSVAFALNEEGLISFRNSASFAGVTTDRGPLLRDLILGVAYASDAYWPVLSEVANGRLDSSAALERLSR